MNLWFHPDAEAEHLDQVAWYESRQAGLGARYLAATEDALHKIVESPGRFPLFGEPAIRRAPVVAFPLHIFFRATPTGIEVLAVSHHRRRPLYWMRRTRE